MNFCTKCGQPRASAATVFCTHCGARLDELAGVPPVSAEKTPPVPAAETVTPVPADTLPAAPDAADASRLAPPYDPRPHDPGPDDPGPDDRRPDNRGPDDRYDRGPYDRGSYGSEPSEPELSEPPPQEPGFHVDQEYADYGDYLPTGSRRKIVAIAAAVIAVLVVGGAAAWVTTRHLGHTPSASAGRKPAAGAASHAAAAQTPAPTPTPSQAQTPSATPTPSATTPLASTGIVSPAPGVAGEQAEAAVEAFLDRYFAAINAHSYRQFRRLLSPPERARIPRSAFESGDGTTTDSAAVLTSITSAANGGLAASITFTSHQAPADSPNDSSCTAWTITLYLEQLDSSYAIVPPPASYQASYEAC